MDGLHNSKCAARHITEWAIEPQWMAHAVEAIKSGLWKAEDRALDNRDIQSASVRPDKNGIAVISLDGPLMKGFSKYGGTSTLWFRQALRNAVNDARTNAILLSIDSPGGTVAGTMDAAEEVKKANAIKPVFAQIDDLGASAAYWIASQARKVYANSTALVGSIGTYSVLYDMSGNAELQGIKVHVVSTGDYKGAGEPGTEITPEQIEYTQERVDSLNEYFLKAVMDGRGMSRQSVDGVADGRVWIAKTAKSMGLIDGVRSFDDTLEAIGRKYEAVRRVSRSHHKAAVADMKGK